MEDEYENAINTIAAKKDMDPPRDFAPFNKFNEDVCYVLVEKTTGEAGAKVKSVEPG